MTRKDWTARDCYFAVWGYDQLDQDRRRVKTHIYEELASITGRSEKSVEWKIQNVSSLDPRPREEKPIAEAPNAQKLLGEIFKLYWSDKEYARSLFYDYLQESIFKKENTAVFSVEVDYLADKNIIIEEGAEGFVESKTKKRSAMLRKKGREYFKSINSGNLVCYACGYIKPDSINGEIIQLHHTDMISEVDKNGKAMSLENAIKKLIPLCPTCHQIAHTKKPPLTLDELKKICR